MNSATSLGSNRIEAPSELAVLKISQLSRDDRPLPGEEEQLQVLREVAHVVRGEERPADMVLAEGDSGFLAVERQAHRLKNDRLLAERPRSPSKISGVTTTKSAPTRRWDIARQGRRFCSLSVRLRYPDQLRRALSGWPRGRS